MAIFSQLPKMTGKETTEQKMSVMMETYHKLNKELEYSLNNIDLGNFNDVFAQQIKDIKKKTVIMKGTSTVLTFTEIGDILCESATPITITLPAPMKGLWYNVINIGTGLVTVFYDIELAVLKQGEQALVLANNTTAWWVNKTSPDYQYVHSQTLASSTWTIAHNLNKFPSVTVVDSAGTVVNGEIKYVNKNEVNLIFSSEFSGKAYFN